MNLADSTLDPDTQLPVPETRTLICPHCTQPTSATIRGIAVWDGRDPYGNPRDPPAEWALLQCSTCGQPIVECREDYGRGFDDDPGGVVFPAPRRLSPTVPQPLAREWQEARTCFDSKAYAACVVMVRRTLEGTCEFQGVANGTLAQRLTKLREEGLIDGTLAEWADALRIAGNQGAHFTGEAVSRQDAEDALAFGEALLDHIYVLRKRFESFRSRLQ